jgi:hypothetical protein
MNRKNIPLVFDLLIDTDFFMYIIILILQVQHADVGTCGPKMWIIRLHTGGKLHFNASVLFIRKYAYTGHIIGIRLLILSLSVTYV